MSLFHFLVYVPGLCEKDVKESTVCVKKGKRDSTSSECMSKLELCLVVYECVSVLVFSVLEHCFIVLIYSLGLCVICFKSQLEP